MKVNWTKEKKIRLNYEEDLNLLVKDGPKLGILFF